MSLEANLKDALTRVATEFKIIRTLTTGYSNGDLSGLSTTTKTSLVAAINELKSFVDTVNANSLTIAEVDARIALLIDAAPAALDTLNELAAALGDDPAFAATVNTALGFRVRFDAAQSLTEGQKTQALTNIGGASTAVATTLLNGLMSSADKSKLDGVQAGAQVNVATNLGYTAAASSGTVTSSAGSSATMPAATTSLAGLMTGADKTKLNGIATGATANTGTVTSVSMTVPTGLSVAGSPITTSGTFAITLASGYAIPTTAKQGQWDTAYGWGNHASAGYLTSLSHNHGVADSSGTQQFTFGVDDSVRFAASGSASVTFSAATKTITVGATNTTYTAGTGLSLTGNAFSLSGVSFSSTDKSKLDGIAAGAQVNTVTSVAGKTGAVTLAKADVGLGSVDNTADSAKTVSKANTLTTPRSINGTNFDGSASITTLNWGTARTVTIGATGKSVNGGANITWTLAEIGAAAESHTHDDRYYTKAEIGLIEDSLTQHFEDGLGSVLPLTGGTLSGNLTVNGTVSAQSFIGDGSQLTGIASPGGMEELEILALAGL